MALRYAICRAASKVVLAAFSAPNPSSVFPHNRTSAFFVTAANGNIFQTSIPSITRRYSSRPSADASQDSEQVEEVPGGLPFKIEDKPGEENVNGNDEEGPEFSHDPSIVRYYSPDTTSDDELKNLFESWMKEHRKKYKSKEEKLYRFEIFKKKLKTIDETNKANLGYTAGLNQYSDLGVDELWKLCGQFSMRSYRKRMGALTRAGRVLVTGVHDISMLHTYQKKPKNVEE